MRARTRQRPLIQTRHITQPPSRVTTLSTVLTRVSRPRHVTRLRLAGSGDSTQQQTPPTLSLKRGHKCAQAPGRKYPAATTKHPPPGTTPSPDTPTTATV